MRRGPAGRTKRRPIEVRLIGLCGAGCKISRAGCTMPGGLAADVLCALFLALAASPLCAQDRVVTPSQDLVGEILGVEDGGAIRIRTDAGTLTVQTPLVKRVDKAAPPEFERSAGLYHDGKYAEALTTLEPLVEKFRGLPTDWAMNASSLLGDTLVALNEFDRAEDAYEAFKTTYPGEAGSERAEIGMARIEVEKGNLDGSDARLAPFAERAMQELAPDAAASSLYGQVFLLQGRIEEARGNKPEALEHYLRTVMLFHEDLAARQEAADRAARLEEEGVLVP